MKNPSRMLAILSFVFLIVLSLRAYAVMPKETPPQVWTPGCVATVPKAWGQYKGGSTQSGLAFEDSNGTLRFATSIPCGATPPVALEIRRIADN